MSITNLRRTPQRAQGTKKSLGSLSFHNIDLAQRSHADTHFHLRFNDQLRPAFRSILMTRMRMVVCRIFRGVEAGYVLWDQITRSE